MNNRVIERGGAALKINLKSKPSRKAGFCLLVLLTAVPVRAQLTFNYVKIADSATAIPNGTGNFAGFLLPANNGFSVAFSGFNATHQGLYRSTAGVLTRLVDPTTPVPRRSSPVYFGRIDIPSARGTGVAFHAALQQGFFPAGEGIYRAGDGGAELIADLQTPFPSDRGANFTAFGPEVSSSGGLVCFSGANSFEAGVYVGDGFGFNRVADLTTAVPSGTGNFLGWGSHAMDGNTVAVRGIGENNQQGIYIGSAGNLLSRVVDKGTSIPSGLGTFTLFGDPSISGSRIAFLGQGTNGQVGIYSDAGGVLFWVADTNTIIPGGFGRFTGFGDQPPSLDGENVAFVGGSIAFSQTGIYFYTRTNGTLHKVVDKNSVLGGKTVDLLNLHREGLSGGSIAFWVRFTDGTSGVWKAVLPTPFQPALRIEAVPPASVRLLWPTNDPAFGLQFSTNLTVTNWTAASPAPVILGTNNVVTNAIMGAQKFYRLSKP